MFQEFISEVAIRGGDWGVTSKEGNDHRSVTAA